MTTTWPYSCLHRGLYCTISGFRCSDKLIYKHLNDINYKRFYWAVFVSSTIHFDRIYKLNRLHYEFMFKIYEGSNTIITTICLARSILTQWKNNVRNQYPCVYSKFLPKRNIHWNCTFIEYWEPLLKTINSWAYRAYIRVRTRLQLKKVVDGLIWRIFEVWHFLHV